jgi:hypothetical protein
VPSGSGEQAKGVILTRAVQYIHHLKKNEARNIGKCTPLEVSSAIRPSASGFELQASSFKSSSHSQISRWNID